MIEGHLSYTRFSTTLTDVTRGSGLTPPKWSTPHVGFGRVGGPFDGAQEEAQP
jgi:hypothetical protein